MVRIERISSLEGVIALQKEWEGLLERCPYRDLYLTHEWISLWCRHFAEGKDLHVLLVRDGERLIGIAPLMIAAEKLRGLPLRKLGFLLNGCSVKSNFIVPPEEIEKFFDALVNYFVQIKGRWDLLSLHGISEASALLPSLVHRTGGRSGLPALAPSSWDNAVIPIDRTWEDFIKSRSRHFKKRLKVTERDLNTRGKVTVARYRERFEADLAMDKIFDIEGRSWKATRGETMAARRDYRAFYLDVVKHFAERGAWRAWILEVDGKAVASHFGFLDQGIYYAEKQSYDSDYAIISPGKSVFRVALEDTFREGMAREIDLDSRTGFSEHWADLTRRHYELFLFNRRVYSRFLWGAKRFVMPVLAHGMSLLRERAQ